MTSYIDKLYIIIAEDIFGAPCARIVRFLLRQPGAVLSSICQAVKNPKLSIKQVKEVLAILYHHQLLIVKSSERSPDIKNLQIDKEKFLYFMLFPKFIEILERKKNRLHGVIMQELFMHGRNPPSSAVFQAAQYMKNATAADPDASVSVKDVIDRFLELVKEKYIVPVPPMDGTEDQVKSIVLEPELGPGIQQKIALALEQDLPELNFQENQHQLWTLNFEKCGQDIRCDVMQDAASRTYDQNAAEVLRLVHGYIDEKMLEGQFLNFNADEVVSQARRRQLLTKSKDVPAYLQLLAHKDFIRKVEDSFEGVYANNDIKCLERLVRANVESVVRERFGVGPARIFNIVQSEGLVSIEDLYPKNPLSTGDVHRHVHTLVNNGFIQQYDYLKSGPVSSVKTMTWMPTLEKISFIKVVRSVLERYHQALLNLKLVSKREVEDSAEIFGKKSEFDNLVEEVNEAKAKDPDQSDDLDKCLLVFFPEDQRRMYSGAQKKCVLLNGLEVKLATDVLLFESYLKAVTTKHVAKVKASLASSF